MENIYFGAVECCPHCGHENEYLMWDATQDGYTVKCNYCGEEILLCDECFHADDNLSMRCDWKKNKCGGYCFRGRTKNNTVITYDVGCFERELVVIFPHDYDEYRTDIIDILDLSYDRWNCVEDIEDDEERQYIQFSCLEEYMIEEMSKQFPEWLRWKSEYYGNEETEKEITYWVMNERR